MKQIKNQLVDKDGEIVQAKDKILNEMILDFSIVNKEAREHSSHTEVCKTISGMSQEPWPEDVVLYQPYKDEQMILPDLSNCLAVEAFLRMCHLEYQIEERSNAEAMSPTLKVPFIKADRYVLSGLDGILQFVETKGITLTDKLAHEERFNMKAYMSLLTNMLELAELYVCWFDKQTYNNVTSIRNGFAHSWPLNHIQNRMKQFKIGRKLQAFEWYQKSIEDVLLDVETCCEALSVRLDGKPLFFEGGPTELDALVFGHLSAILRVPLPRNELASKVMKFPSLVQFVRRINADYFKSSWK
ncbi:unnamed protein product [Phaedon cochleariae]|uniref:Metaxin-2 n=1 Tax=Phaedon cochleariae TaxID=80249 RepID=A0A9P0GV65_PHACE|nr:unnamed protein product [Phaedon cochleariae]